MGRPRKYKPDELEAKWDEYFYSCLEKDELPHKKGFAVFLKVNSDTLYNYLSNEPQYSECNKKLEDMLETAAIRLASNAKNPAFLIFYMKNKFGWADKQENKLIGEDGKGLQINFNIPRPEK